MNCAHPEKTWGERGWTTLHSTQYVLHRSQKIQYAEFLNPFIWTDNFNIFKHYQVHTEHHQVYTFKHHHNKKVWACGAELTNRGTASYWFLIFVVHLREGTYSTYISPRGYVQYVPSALGDNAPSFLEIVSILELQDGFRKAATLEG